MIGGDGFFFARIDGDGYVPCLYLCITDSLDFDPVMTEKLFGLPVSAWLVLVVPADGLLIIFDDETADIALSIMC
jgi:hypothetical protein